MTTSKSKKALTYAQHQRDVKRKATAKRNAKALRRDYLSRAVLGKLVERFRKAHGLTQTRVAQLVDDAATQMSRLSHGHFAEFSSERLIGFLVELGHDVQVVVRVPKRAYGARGRVKIVTLPKS